VPSERVRKMEIRANEAFDVYRELYYEGGVSSVYFWNLDDGFAGVVLLKKGMLILLFHSYWVPRLNQWLIFSKSCTFGEERGELGFNSCV
jgi:hypothetical protein